MEATATTAIIFTVYMLSSGRCRSPRMLPPVRERSALVSLFLSRGSTKGLRTKHLSAAYSCLSCCRHWPLNDNPFVFGGGATVSSCCEVAAAVVVDSIRKILRRRGRGGGVVVVMVRMIIEHHIVINPVVMGGELRGRRTRDHSMTRADPEDGGG